MAELGKTSGKKLQQISSGTRKRLQRLFSWLQTETIRPIKTSLLSAEESKSDIICSVYHNSVYTR